jgi:hypothetical protein
MDDEQLLIFYTLQSTFHLGFATLSSSATFFALRYCSYTTPKPFWLFDCDNQFFNLSFCFVYFFEKQILGQKMALKPYLLAKDSSELILGPL